MPTCIHCDAAVLSSQRTCPMCFREVNPDGKDLLVTEQRKPKSRTTKNFGASVPDLDRYAYAGTSGVPVSEPLGHRSQSRGTGQNQRSKTESPKRGSIAGKRGVPGSATLKPPKATIVIVSLKGQKSCFQVSWNDNGGPRKLRSIEFSSALLRTPEGETTVARIHSSFLRDLKKLGWQVTKQGATRFAVTVAKDLSRTGAPSPRGVTPQRETKASKPREVKTETAKTPSKGNSSTYLSMTATVPKRTSASVRLARVSSETFCFVLMKNDAGAGPRSAQFPQWLLESKEGKTQIEKVRKKFVDTLTLQGWKIVGKGTLPFEILLAKSAP